MTNYYNKDLYKILELSFDASSDDIKAAYRKLVRLYHPDVTGNSSDGAKFKEITEAYEILINPEKRKKYDILHGFYREKFEKNIKKNKSENKYEKYAKESKFNKKTKESFSKSFNDALDSLFKTNAKRDKNSANPHPPVNGKDISIDVNVSCFEALNGTNRKINILHTQPCPNCEGRTFINGSVCKMCSGTGVLSVQKKINVKIPKDVKQGSKVRIKKEGDKGLYGGKDGDLYLIINIEKNGYYEIEGYNLLCTLPITPFEAVLGTSVEIPVVDGSVTVSVPPMISSGQKLTIPSQGISNKSGTKRGDLIITVMIKLPQNLSAEETELYKKLKRLSSADIREDMKNVK